MENSCFFLSVANTVNVMSAVLFRFKRMCSFDFWLRRHAQAHFVSKCASHGTGGAICKPVLPRKWQRWLEEHLITYLCRFMDIQSHTQHNTLPLWVTAVDIQ